MSEGALASAVITATEATATHPVAEHPEWDLGL
jgi:hypothetical protein